MMGQKYFVTVTPAGTSVNLEADPYLFPQATAEELAAVKQEFYKRTYPHYRGYDAPFRVAEIHNTRKTVAARFSNFK